MSRNRKPFPPVNRKVRSSVPSRLPPLVQSSPSTDEELNAVAAEGKALVRAQLVCNTNIQVSFRLLITVGISYVILPGHTLYLYLIYIYQYV